MAELSAEVLARMASGASLKLGTVEAVSPLTVALDGAPMAAVLAHPLALAAGEPVWCGLSGGTVLVLGSAAERPQFATVTAMAGSTVAVSSGSWSMSGVPIITGSVPGIGAGVALLWGASGAYGIGATVAPAAPVGPAGAEVAPPTPAGLDSGRYEDALIDARCTAVRTSRSGAYRTDVGSTAYQGHYSGGSSADNSGWFFYGGALASPGGIAGGCFIRLIRPRSAGIAGPVDFRLRLHTSTTPGSTPPTATADAEKVAALSWGDDIKDPPWSLGAAWGQKLLDGTASGVGIVYAGTADYGSLLGPSATHPLAAQITIPYRRKVS